MSKISFAGVNDIPVREIEYSVTVKKPFLPNGLEISVAVPSGTLMTTVEGLLSIVKDIANKGNMGNN